MIDKIFPVLIYREFLNEFEDKNQYLKEKAYSIKEKCSSEIKTSWRCDTFNTIGHYKVSDDHDKIVVDLVQECGQHVLKFAENFGIRSNNIVCTDFWFNVAKPGTYQEYHQHSNSHFSLAYYIDAPEKSGNIVFKSFESITDMMPLPVDEPNLNENSYKSYYYEPKNSMLLIFRSNLLHMVEKNFSDKDRLSISMNFRFD